MGQYQTNLLLNTDSTCHLHHFCHDLAKRLSYYLYFFSFLLLLSWTYYTEESVMSQVSHHMTESHSITSHDWSHDRHGKIVHRPCSSYISSIENLTGTLSSSLC